MAPRKNDFAGGSKWVKQPNIPRLKIIIKAFTCFLNSPLVSMVEGESISNMRPCERVREDEDDDGEQRVNAVFFFFLIRRINDLITNF